MLVSCSYKGIVISNLPYLITNRVDNRLDLTGEQFDQMKENITKYLAQNKASISNLNKEFQKFDIKETNKKEFYQEVRKRYIKIAHNFVPLLTKTMSTFNEEQIKEFIRKDHKNLKKREEKFTNAAPDYFVARYERFFGDLTQKQKSYIKSKFDTLRKSQQNWMMKRNLFHTQLKVIFEYSKDTKESGDSLEQKLTDAFKNYIYKSTKYKDRELAFKVLEGFIPSLTTEQLEFFEQNKVEINEWIEIYVTKY